MATYTVRGNAHNIVLTFKDQTGKSKQHWESYTTELEAMQRKAYIDYLQKTKQRDMLLKAIAEYKQKREAERLVNGSPDRSSTEFDGVSVPSEDNTKKTYREFADKWLPYHARKSRISPNTYDSYSNNLNTHILPYFGDRVMSTIRSEEIDDFVDFLSKKPCRGSKSYHKRPDDVPTLASSTVKKCYNILTSGFKVAKKWGYVTETPETSAPAEKYARRKAWDPTQVLTVLAGIKDDSLLHLAVHIAFVCSLRAGETAGIDIKTIDFHDRSLWITQEVQRVSDRALSELPKNEIIRVFPKLIPSSKSSMILKRPKTEGSHRKQYLTTPLLHEIKERIERIKLDKEFFGSEYQDYGLLFCQPDGRPIEPTRFVRLFKEHQDSMHIKEQIEFQGLRKSGQMHKVRLTKNNYQLVAENGGQSPEVLMSNYNEALDSEKRTLSLLVETSFYAQDASIEKIPQQTDDIEIIVQALQNNPELSGRLLQTLLSNAVSAL